MPFKLFLLLLFFINFYQCITILSVVGPPLTGGDMYLHLDTPNIGHESYTIQINNSAGSDLGLCENVIYIIGSNNISCTAPSSPSGLGGVFNVTIVSLFGNSPPKIFAYQPKITSVSLVPGNVGGPLAIILGKGFVQGYGPTEFYLSYQAYGFFSVNIISNSHIQCILNDTVRSGDVSLFLLNSQSNGVTLLWPPAPAVDQVPTFKSNTLYLKGACLSQVDVSNYSVFINYYSISSITHETVLLSCIYTPNILYQVNCTGLPVPDNYYFTLYVNNTGGSTTVDVIYQRPIIVHITSLFYKLGGNVTIYGQNFAPSSSNISVEIGSETCTSPRLLDDESIECFFSANIPQTSKNSKLSVQVTSYEKLNTTLNLFSYYEDLLCGSINSEICSGKGTCDRTTGFCSCITGWGDNICSTQKQGDPKEPPKTDDNGVTTIPADSVSFKVNIGYIREISTVDSTLKIFKTLDMSTAKWNKTINSTETHSIFIGKFKDSNCTVQIETTYYKNSANVVFADTQIPIDPNSVKYNVKVFGWKFSSILNELQVVFVSSQQDTSKCTSTTSESYWVQITSNKGAILSGKFSNRAIIDGRIYQSKVVTLSPNDPLFNSIPSTKRSSTILSAIETPSFRNNIELDPNFSSLLFKPELDSDQYIDEDGCIQTVQEKFATWKIIVICVCCSFVVIVTLVVVLSKKKLYYLYQGFKSQKLKNLK